MFRKLKKALLPVLAVALMLSTLMIGVSADDPAPKITTYADGVLTFSAYTDGASAAFDGNASTTFDGSITGSFDKPTVITGVTVLTTDKLTDITVEVSANGVDWIEIYNQSAATKMLPAEFGGAGPEVTTTGGMRDMMYTYVVKYVRIETASGKISEVKLFGYAVDVVGTEVGLDTSYGTTGWTASAYNYNPPKTEFVFDHIFGADWNKGDVIKSADGDDTKTAYLAVKLAKKTALTEIVFMPRYGESDAIYNRQNGIYYEASVDGENWTTLVTTPTDLTTQNGIGKTTYAISVIKITDTTEYQYVRVRSDINSVVKGWLTFAELNFYGTAETVTAPANVLNGWEGDPHVKEAPATQEPTTESTTAPEAPTAEVTEAEGTKAETPAATTEAPSEEKKGCGAAVTVSMIGTVAVVAGAWLSLKKKED